MKKRIPFKIKNMNYGLSEASGLLHLGEEELIFEFESRDSVIGVIKSGLQEHNVSLADIDEINYLPKWIGARVEVVGRSMKVMAGIPGSEHGTVTLHIRHKHKKQAERAVSTARLVLSEHKLNSLED